MSGDHEAAAVNYTVRIDLVGVRLVFNATSGFNETVEVNRTTWSAFNVTLADSQNGTRPTSFRINATGLWKVQFLLYREGVLTNQAAPSVREGDPPASPEFAETLEIVGCVWTFTIQIRIAPFGGDVVQFDCTQSIVKNFVVFPFELSTLSPQSGLRSFNWRFAITYGSVAVPDPETTPFAAVKSASCLIWMGLWCTGAQFGAMAG